MIKSITIKNTLDETDNGLTIELGAPEKTGLWVKSIKGIGPGKADINTTDFASSDGGVFNSSRSQIRNITFTLGILEYTDASGRVRSVEEVRHSTYKWLSKKKEISFTVTTDRTELIAYGYVESADPDIFNKKETMSVSIVCPDPNWYTTSGASIATFSGTIDLFEFPVAFKQTTDRSFLPGKDYYEYNEDTGEYYLTSDQTMKSWKIYYEEDLEESGYENLITSEDGYVETTDEEMQIGKMYYEYDALETRWYFPTSDVEFIDGKTYYEYQDVTVFAEISQLITKDINYSGENETGILIILRFGEDASNVKIYKFYDEYTHGSIEINDDAIASITGSGITIGDEIRICTIKGKKYATLIRQAQEYNILNALGKNPDWFQLVPGLNTFSYEADEQGFDSISLEMDYIKAYEGI